MEEIYTKYYKELYLYAFTLCKDHHLAQDLTSDTFFKAYISLEDHEMHFKYWLFRVCKNLFIDGIRKGREIYSDDYIKKVESDEETPLQKILDNEKKRALFERIMRLSPSYREVLILYYYCDFTILEISKSKGTTVGAVKTLLSRGRKKLKSELEGKHEL